MSNDAMRVIELEDRSSQHSQDASAAKDGASSNPSNLLPVGSSSGDIIAKDVSAKQYLDNAQTKRMPKWRRSLKRFVEHRVTEALVIIFVAANALFLAAEDPTKENPGRNDVVEVADIVFTYIFAAELVLKLLALGFFEFRFSYFNRKAHWLDAFVIVVTTVVKTVELISGFGYFDTITALRMVRVLRPIRLITVVPAFRLLVNAVLRSIPFLSDVLLIYAVVVLFFGVLGVFFFEGKMGMRCVIPQTQLELETLPNGTEVLRNVTAYTVTNFRTACTPLDDPFGYKCPWGQECVSVKSDHFGKRNFDNVGKSMVVVFLIATFSGRAEVMYQTMDCTSDASAFFCVAIALFCSYSVVNLALAIINDAFMRAVKEEDEAAAAGTSAANAGGNEDELETSLSAATPRNGKATGGRAGEQTPRLAPDGNPLSSRATTPYEAHLDPVDPLSDRGSNKATTPRNDRRSDNQVSDPSQQHQQHQQQSLSLEGDSEPPQQTRNDSSALFADESLVLARRGSEELHVSAGILSMDDDSRAAAAGSRPRLSKVVIVRHNMRHIARSEPFRKFIAAVLVANFVTLMLDHHNAPSDLITATKVLNIVFSALYTVELVWKLVAFGRRFFRDGFNIFDLIVVVLAWLDIILLTDDDAGIAALRSFRLLRVIRLTNQFSTLKKWVSTLVLSVKEAGALTLLLIFVTFLFSLIGVQLFGGKLCDIGDPFNDPSKSLPASITGNLSLPYAERCVLRPRQHFDNVMNAALTMFQVLTAEDYEGPLYMGMRATNDAAVVFFLTYFVVGVYILLNTFIALMLNNRDKLMENEDVLPADDEAIVPLPLIKVVTASIEFAGHDLSPTSNTGGDDAAPHSDGGPSPPPIPTLHDDEGPWIAPLETYSDDDDANNGASGQEKSFFQRLASNRSSLFIIPYKSRARRRLLWFVTHPYFDMASVALIFLSCVAVAAQDPLLPPDHEEVRLLNAVSYAFSAIFAFELALKVVAQGFVIHRHAYLRDWWNVIDFLAVILSIVADATATDTRVLKVFRCLRPLRFVARSNGMKLVIQSLIDAVPAIGYISLILAVVIAVFGVVGVQLFKGKFYRCTQANYGDLDAVYRTKSECLAAGYSWVTFGSNFDHIGNAFVALCETMTFQGWVTLMNLGMDARSHEEAPERDSQWWMAIYIVVFIIIASYFTVSCFVATLMQAYDSRKKALQAHFRTVKKDKLLWLSLHDVAIDAVKQMRNVGRVSKWRMELRRVALSHIFAWALIGVVALNTAAIASEHTSMPTSTGTVIDSIHLACQSIFLVEMFVLVIALGLRGYWTQTAHRLEVLITLCCWAGVIVAFVDRRDAVIPELAKMIALTRLFRILRIVAGVRTLLATLWLSLRPIFDVFSVLLMHLFFFAVLGMSLFARIDDGEEINRRTHFRTFTNAMLVMGRLLNGEGWEAYRRDCATRPPLCSEHLGTCGDPVVSTLFYMIFIVTGMYVLLNCLLSIVVSSFDTSNGAASALTAYHMDQFNRQWLLLDPDANGLIRVVDVARLLANAGSPLGFPASADAKARRALLWSIGRQVSELIAYEGKALDCARVQYAELVPHLITALIATRFPLERTDDETQDIREKWCAAYPLPFENAGSVQRQPMVRSIAAIVLQRVWRACIKRRRGIADAGMSDMFGEPTTVTVLSRFKDLRRRVE